MLHEANYRKEVEISNEMGKDAKKLEGFPTSSTEILQARLPRFTSTNFDGTQLTRNRSVIYDHTALRSTFWGSKGQMLVSNQADAMFSFVKAFSNADPEKEKKYRLLMLVRPSDFLVESSRAWL
jgi:hypothetical protein